MSTNWPELIRQSVLDPRRAAPIIVNIPLDRSAIFLGLALVACLNGIFYGLVLPMEFQMEAFASPVPLALAVGVIVWLSAAALTVVGRLFGGEGTLETLLRVGIWMQLIRLGVQVVLLFVELLSPSLAWMLAMAAWVWGIYMTITFTAAAHRFDTLLKAVGVLGVSFFGAVLALSVLLAALGVAPMEI